MIERAARAGLNHVFDRIGGGRLEVVEAGRARVFGEPEAELQATVRVNNARAWLALLHGSVGVGRSYSDGWWDCDDLVSLFRIGARNMPRLDVWRRRIHPVTGRAQRLAGRIPRNTRAGARSNVAAHYDLGNDLFELYLDPRMQYSCAYFPYPGATLEQAQLAKLERLCEGLQLRPDDHLLEIGTGWGGLAIHAAAEHGCRVTTTTLSAQQRDYALGRIAEAGLEDRVEVLLSDYRDLRGSYDKLVSVEMIEAVGWQYFDTFFACCSRLLAPDGLMLLQAIVIDDRAYELEKVAKSFANTLIFPGGCLPSRAKIAECIGRVTDMRQLWMEDITAHYAETLAAWEQRFRANEDRIGERGYDERFRRLWRLYFQISEAGFRERRLGDVQLLLAKPAYRRDDLPAAERRVRQAALTTGGGRSASGTVSR
ncbi:MAG: cyclopropane-fatty-acyl-phospholipid synthase family protein [Actinomycetota bacterium]